MKIKFFILAVACGLASISFSQNVGVNSDGSAPESGVMLDVKGTNPLTTTGTQNVFQIKSFDASTSALKLRMILGTNAAAANTYGGLEVYDAANAAYRALALQPNGGNVGVGTSSPSTILDVVSSSFSNRGITNQYIVSDNNGPYLSFQKSRGSVGAYTPLLSGDVVGALFFYGNDATASIGNFQPGGYIRLKADENWSGTAHGSHLEFWTTKNTTTSTSERMRIDDAGNVGIGTTSPSYLLHVYSNQNTGVYQANENANTGASVLAGMLAKTDAGLAGFQLASIANGGWAEFGSSGSGGVYYSVWNNSGDHIFRTTALNTERMRITSAGNVGIGQTVPTARLHVSYLSPSAGMYACKIQNTGTAASAPGAALIVSNGYPAAQGAENYEVFGVYGNNFGSSYLTVSDDGHVGIGTINPGSPYTLAVNGQPGANGYTAFTNYSDARLKKNIADISSSLDKIMRLRPVQFNYNEEYLNLYNDTSSLSRLQKGFIAQEVKEIFPEMVGCVKVKGKEYYDLNLSNLQIYMVKAMQEQQKMIEEQKEIIVSLQKENQENKTTISLMGKRLSEIETAFSQTTMK